HELDQLLTADHARFVLVAAGAGPMRFQTDPAFIPVADQRVYLAAPADHAVADCAPQRLVAVHRAILRVYVLNARDGEFAVALGERLLAGDDGIRRVPYDFQIRMIERGERARRFRSGSDVARVLVFEADDHVVLSGLIGEIAERGDHAIEARVG